jgi:hypothetical protein
MRLPARLYCFVNDFFTAFFRLDHDRSSEELLRFVKGLAGGNEETERAVRIAADAEDGGMIAFLTAELHRRADMTVAVFVNAGTGVFSGQ